MKLVREYINEKFTEDSDPIRDIGIGKTYYIQKWIDYYSIKTTIDRNHNFKDNCIINSDFTIDVNGNISLNSCGLYKLPNYIKFNKIRGDFMINWNNFENMIGCPRIILGGFYINGNPLKSLEGFPKKIRDRVVISRVCKISVNQIKKICDVPEVYYTDETYQDVYRKKEDYSRKQRIGKIEDYVFENFEENSYPI